MGSLTANLPTLRIVDLKLEFDWASAAKTMIDRSCARSTWAGLDPRQTFNSHSLACLLFILAYFGSPIRSESGNQGEGDGFPLCPSPSPPPAIRLTLQVEDGSGGQSRTRHLGWVGCIAGSGEGRGAGRSNSSTMPTRVVLGQIPPVNLCLSARPHTQQLLPVLPLPSRTRTATIRRGPPVLKPPAHRSSPVL